MVTDVSKDSDSLGLNMKQREPFETLETIFELEIYPLTPGYILEDSNLQQCHCQNLKSRTLLNT
jgi:hypothetical protein